MELQNFFFYFFPSDTTQKALQTIENNNEHTSRTWWARGKLFSDLCWPETNWIEVRVENYRKIAFLIRSFQIIRGIKSKLCAFEFVKLFWYRTRFPSTKLKEKVSLPRSSTNKLFENLSVTQIPLTIKQVKLTDQRACLISLFGAILALLTAFPLQVRTGLKARIIDSLSRKFLLQA